MIRVMIKKFLLIETTLMSAFIALFFSFASMSKHNSQVMAQNTTQTSIHKASHATTTSHSIYRSGGVYPEP